jgi:HlyD family secretion protein
MKRLIAGLALAGVLAWAVYYNLRERAAPARQSAGTLAPVAQAPIQIAPVARHASETTISAIGMVRADRQAAVSARIVGRVVAVEVREGQSVRTGESLVRLDVGDAGAQVAGAQAGLDAAEAQYRKAVEGKSARSVEMDSQISQAEGGLRTALAKQRQAELALKLNDSSTSSDLEKAEAGLRQAEAGLRQAETGYRQATDTLKRLQFLYDHGGIARADLEGAQAQADIAKAQRDSAVAALAQARASAGPAQTTAPLRQEVSKADLEAARAGVRQAREAVRNAHRAKADALRIGDADIAAARAQVEQARAGRRQAVSQSGGSALTAPFAGVVSDLAIRAGEVAQPGQPLMTIVGTESVYVEVAVPARNVAELRSGMAATVRLDTVPDRPLEGRISEILPVSADSRSISVRVRFTGGKPLPGTGARVDIKVKDEG